MSGPRASSRVLELAARACEAALRRELAEIAKEDEILAKVQECLEQGVRVQEDFALPFEWIREKRARRARSYNDSESDSDEDNVAPEVLIPRYRKLRQNLYKAPLQRPAIPLEECSHSCNCKFGSGCGSQCHNRLVYMECVPGQCPTLVQPGMCHSWHNKNRSGVKMEVEDDADSAESEDNIGYCENTAIQTRTYPAVEVFLTSESPSTELSASIESVDNQVQSEPSSKKKKGSTIVESAKPPEPASRGYGLRLLEPVRKGTLLIEYLGEVITAAEGARRMSEYVLGDDFYFMGLDNGLMLDAKTMGSAARFANHSCAPSCLLQKWTVRGECRLVLVAKRDLPAGAEITYNYHYFDDSFEGVRGMKRQKCMCGAKHCCGTIGGRVIKGTRMNTDIAKGSSSRNRGRPTSTGRSANDNTALVYEDSDSEDEFVSIKDMYLRCVSLQLLSENKEDESIGTEKPNNVGSGTCGGSSRVDLTTLANSYASLDNAAITNPLSNSTKKYTMEFLQSLTGEIRTCIEKNTALGLANVPTTRFISNSDHLVQKLQLLVSELEYSVEQANAWVKQYDSIFCQPDINADSTSSSNNVTKLVHLIVAQELVFIAPKNVKIEQVALLEGQIRTLLKVKRMLDHCVNETPVVRASSTTDLLVPIKAEPSSSTSSIARTAQASTTGANDSIKQAATSLHWDDLLSTTRLLLSALPLTLGDTYILELLKRYETYSLWVRQTLSPVVTGCSGAKSRRTTAAMTTQTSANSKKSAHVNNHSSGLDSTSAEFEEYALLLRLLDTFCLQEHSRINHLPSVSAVSTDLVTTAQTYVGPDTTMEIVTTLPPTLVPALKEYEEMASDVLPLTTAVTESSLLDMVQLESSSTVDDAVAPAMPAAAKKQKGRSKQAAATVTSPLLVLSQPLLTDIFSAAQFYDSRLSVYMEKLQIESALQSGATEPIVHKNYSQMLTEVPTGGERSSDDLYFENNVDWFTQWEVRQTGLCTVQESYEKLQNANKFTSTNITAPTNAPSNTDTNDVLYCFCRLPEADGESSILTECSICSNWYHPQCVNSGYTTLSAAARQKSFLCPVCMHLDGQVSSLSYLPNEWNIIKPVATKLPEPKKDTTKTSNKTGGRHMMTGRVSNNIGGMSSTLNAEDDMSSGKRKRSDTTSTSSASNSAALVSRHPLVKFKSASAVKNKEYITMDELQQMLEKENEHAISGSPVTLLLGLARKYCLSWQDDCRSFLSSDPVRLLLSRIDAYVVAANTVTCTHRSTVSAVPGTTTSTTTVEIILYNTLQHEAVILQRAMQLYLQMRLVRIRGEECTILRQLAWVITTSTLYRRTTTGSAHNNMLSITELSSMVAGGSALFCSASSEVTINTCANTTAYTQCVQSVQTTGTSLLQLLLARQTLATLLLNQANKCTSRSEARTLLPQFRELRDRAMIKTEDTFAFARIKCLSRSTNIGPEATANEQVYNNTVGSPIAAVDPGCNQVDTAAPLVYCWCRKEDSGTPMVCCDGCEEWFHCHCVGLNGLNAPNSRKKKELDTYLCISCSILSGKPYAYGW
eukprot:gene8385-9960_t